jgi:hypothetical protein
MCQDCREQFTVTVNTVFERSKIALNVWLQAVYLICSSKKGISSHQLHRTLGVTYKTAWFMSHRIREAMRITGGGLLGGGGSTVEAELAQQAKISYADAAEQMESAMLFSAIEEQTKDQALQQLRALLGIRP